MSTTPIQNLWPSRIQLPEDPIIDLMREQGELLADATEGLLRAEVRISSLHVALPSTVISGGGGTPTTGATTTPAPPTTFTGSVETVNYYIVPVNNFLNSMEYRLFSFVREVGNSYPLFLQVFPDEKQHASTLQAYKTPYTTPVIGDFKAFVTEFTRVLKTKGVATLLAGMIQVLEGTHRKDTTQDKRVVLTSATPPPLTIQS